MTRQARTHTARRAGRWLAAAAVLTLGLGLAAPAQATLMIQMQNDCQRVVKITLVPFGATGESSEAIMPGASGQVVDNLKRWVLTDPGFYGPMLEALEAGKTYRVFKQSRDPATIDAVVEGFGRLDAGSYQGSINMQCVVGQQMDPPPAPPVGLDFGLQGDWDGDQGSGQANFTGTIEGSDNNYDGRLAFSDDPAASEVSALTLNGQANQYQLMINQNTPFSAPSSFSVLVPGDDVPDPQQVGTDVRFSFAYTGPQGPLTVEDGEQGDTWTVTREGAAPVDVPKDDAGWVSVTQQ